MFDKSYGVIASVMKDGKLLISSPIKFNLWRAPNYNRGSVDRWRLERLDHVTQKTYSAVLLGSDEETAKIECRISLGGASNPPVMRAMVTYTFKNDGSVNIEVDGTVRQNAPALPRLGFEIIMPEGNEQTEYLGLGEIEAYVDRCRAAKFGKFRTTVSDNFEHYIRPQENSAHYGTVSASVTDNDGDGLKFAGVGIDSFSFNASHFTAKMLTETAHDFELVPLPETVVNLDWRINAISENGVRAKKAPSLILNDKAFKFGFNIAIL